MLGRARGLAGSAPPLVGAGATRTSRSPRKRFACGPSTGTLMRRQFTSCCLFVRQMRTPLGYSLHLVIHLVIHPTWLFTPLSYSLHLAVQTAQCSCQCSGVVPQVLPARRGAPLGATARRGPREIRIRSGRQPGASYAEQVASCTFKLHIALACASSRERAAHRAQPSQYDRCYHIVRMVQY